MSRVAAVIPTYNRWLKTRRFLQQFTQQTYNKLTIIVADADSPDGTASKIQECYPSVILVRVDRQQYWAGATNAGVCYALENDYEYILTINDDATVALDYVQRLVALSQRHNLKILGSRIDYLNSPGKVWALGTELNWRTPNFLQLRYSNIDADDLPADVATQDVLAVDTLPGDGVLIHRSIFEEVGLYKSQVLPHYHADSEFILRASRYGLQAYVTPHIVLQDDFSEEQKVQDFTSISGLKYAFFNPKSHLFAPAIAYILFRYCPWYAYPQTLYYLLVRLLRLGKSRLRTEGRRG